MYDQYSNRNGVICTIYVFITRQFGPECNPGFVTSVFDAKPYYVIPFLRNTIDWIKYHILMILKILENDLYSNSS